MAVHVVRDTGGDWRTALANSFLAPLLTGLVNNHFEGLRTAKENALLGELANAAGNMPNTAPEQGNGFAGQFTPPGMMQGGQGGGLNQLFSVLGNPRFKNVNAARAMELAKPWLTEQFYNGFNPADTAQMMRGMGMGYVPKEAASYYSDMYKYQNPHQQFQNMNLGDRVVYGGFNPANGQFTQGGEMAVGMNPYQAGSLANDRQRIANDYALGIRRDDTSRYGMDLQNQQFGATMDYNREGREADNAFRDRQQTWYENPENPRNMPEKKILTDQDGNVVLIDPNKGAVTQTGVKAQTEVQQSRNRLSEIELQESYKILGKAKDAYEAAKQNYAYDKTPENEAALHEAAREYQNWLNKVNRNAAANSGVYIDPNTGAMTSAPQGAAQTQPAQTEQAETPRPNARISAPKRDADGIMRVTPADAEQMIAVLRKSNPNLSMQDIAAWFEANRIIVPNLMDAANTSLLDTFYSIGRANPQTTQPQSRPQAQPKAQPQPSTQPQRTDTAAAMEAIGGKTEPKPQRTQTKAKQKSAPWTEEQMRYWDRMPWNAPKAYKEWKAQNGGR